MLTKIDGYLCKLYGRDNTSLHLSDKADHYCSNSDYYFIWEREADVEDADGSIIDSFTVYAVTGYDKRPMSGWMTEEQTNAYLEELADEDAAQLAEDYFWTAESWGSEYAQESADEIVERANQKIVEFAQDRKWTYAWEVEEYAERLWESYCTTGII